MILCDSTLKGMAVPAFVAGIRESGGPGGDVFILVTGDGAEAVSPEDILAAGADDFLAESLVGSRLLSTLNMLVRIKKLKNEVGRSDRRVEELQEKQERINRDLADVKEELADEKEVLHNSMKQIALMVEERAQANAKIEKLETLLAKTWDNIVSMLVEMVEAKSQFRRGHAAVVKDISVAIARFLEMSEEETGDVGKAALLHELGMISIPDDLSMKNPLDYSELEKDLLIRHPVKGASFLSKFPGLEMITRMIRHIHETADGTGFPDSLKRKRIPMGSRIIAVANAYDNLVSGSADISRERALDLIEKEVGTLYDSRVVNGLRKYVGRQVNDRSARVVEKRIFEVKPGMVLAAAIFTVSGAKLLPENTVLTEEFIRQIVKYNRIDPLEETVFIKE